jgi:hypothetical protein
MNWIKLEKQKPDNYQQCWVMHIKRPSHQYHALYYEPDDTFRLIQLQKSNAHDYPLDITHWVPMPELMSEQMEKQKELEAQEGCKIIHSNSCYYVFENGQILATECKCTEDGPQLKLAQDEYALWKELQ